MLAIGNRIDVLIEDIAHGGMWIARHEGIVVFIRGADIGERLHVEITKLGPKGRFAFADIIEVLEKSTHRTTPPCEYAGICGGCDFQHIEISHQRELKKQVLLNALQKFAGIDTSVWESLQIHALPELNYRTRMRYQATPTGDFGLYRNQSNSIVLIEECKIAASEIAFPQNEIGIVAHDYQGFTDRHQPQLITERVGDFVYELDSNCFWQAHRDAPERFVEIVMRFANIQSGDSVWDLYSGVGLFALPSADRVGIEGSVTAVEGDKQSARFLSGNSNARKQVRAVTSDVEKWLLNASSTADVVILDPPRKGAGKTVMEEIVKKQPRSIVYVACDPVALARDIGVAKSLGYELLKLEAIDAYPETHHVESFALLAQARINVEEKA